jgi:hypothetical protein
METQQQAEAKAKIAALREKYAKLRSICGPQAISQQTREEYARAIETLQAQLH